MANNPQKRDIANHAMAILVAGRTGQAGIFFSTIDDTEFADYTTVSEQDYPDKRVICFVYERVLKMVLQDIVPDFALEYADLGQQHAINQEFGGWEYLFELPTDFLALEAQVAEGDVTKGKLAPGYDCELLHFKDYSHVVRGTDDQAYYCDTDHTSADDASDGQPPANDGNANWTLYSTDGGYGATWAAAVAYKYNRTAWMLATNDLTDDAGNSAYIKYLAYVQAGRSDQPAYYPESFKNALATRLAVEVALISKDYERRTQLLQEYELVAKPAYWSHQGRHRARTKHVTVLEARTR